MAVCQASVMDPVVAPAVAAPPAGSCAIMATPAASISLLVSAIELRNLLPSAPIITSLRDPRFPGGHCDFGTSHDARAWATAGTAARRGRKSANHGDAFGNHVGTSP